MSEAIDLGRITEERFSAAFASTAIITKRAASALLGLDEKTLDALTDRGAVRAVLKGKLRAYTERDLRAYLTEGTAEACPSTSRPRAASTSTIFSGRVAAFTDRQGRKPDAQRKRLSGSSGSTQLKAV